MKALFDDERWRRDGLIVTGLAIAGFGIAVVVFSIVSTLEVGGIVMWAALTLAVSVWILAVLRGSTAGLIGMTYLALMLVNLALGFTVLGITGSEAGLIGVMALLILGVLVVPVTAVWSIVDLLRDPRLRRWQQARYSVEASTADRQRI